MAFQWFPWSPKAWDFIVKCTAKVNLADGSVRSGKSTAADQIWADWVEAAPIEAPLIMTGRTRDTIIANVCRPLMDMFPGECRLVKGDNTFYFFGHPCRLIGVSDERAEEKIRGATIYKAYCDEVSLYPENFFAMLVSRLSMKGSQCVATTNPDGPYHWLKVNYIDRANEPDFNLKHWRFKLDDNYSLDPGYIRDIKAFYRGLWYKRYIDGEWCMAEGIIYDMFDTNLNIVNIDNDTVYNNYFVSIDYGTTNPFVIGLFGYNNGFPVHLIKEYYYDSEMELHQKTDAEYADAFEKFIDGYDLRAIYLDPSAKSFKIQLIQRGYIVADTDNDVAAGIQHVGRLLDNRAFLVDEGCTNTIREFSSYVWDKRKQKLGKDEPLKMYDHCMDLIRYGLYNHFPMEPAYMPVGVKYN